MQVPIGMEFPRRVPWIAAWLFVPALANQDIRPTITADVTDGQSVTVCSFTEMVWFHFVNRAAIVWLVGIGFLMMLVFLHVYFAPFRRLKQAVDDADWPTGGRYLAQIRHLVGLNIILGLVVIAIASGGLEMTVGI